MKLFKLTDKKGCTSNKTKWGENVTHSVTEKKENPNLCTSDVIHAYRNINLAILLNPIHANFSEFLIWEAAGDVVVEDFGKVGCFEITTTKLKQMPSWTEKHKVDVQIMFAVLCAEAVLHNFEKIYPNDDRPRKAIEAAKTYLKDKSDIAASAAYSAANSAVYSAANSAVYSAAYSAAYSAYSAAYSAYSAAYSANSAVYSAANSAAYSANSAVYSAANSAANKIDFALLANKAVQIKFKTKRRRL